MHLQPSYQAFLHNFDPVPYHLGFLQIFLMHEQLEQSWKIFALVERVDESSETVIYTLRNRVINPCQVGYFLQIGFPLHSHEYLRLIS